MRKNLEEKIIEKTQELIQRYGLKYFSIEILAESLEIQKDSIFSYFKDKEELLIKSLQKYRVGFFEALEKIENNTKCIETRINQYIEIHKNVLEDNNKLCLCTVMASEYPTLSLTLKEEIDCFISANVIWIFNATKSPDQDSKLMERARVFVNGIMGIMMVSRANQDIHEFQESSRMLANTLKLY